MLSWVTWLLRHATTSRNSSGHCIIHCAKKIQKRHQKKYLKKNTRGSLSQAMSHILCMVGRYTSHPTETWKPTAPSASRPWSSCFGRGNRHNPSDCICWQICLSTVWCLSQWAPFCHLLLCPKPLDLKCSVMFVFMSFHCFPFVSLSAFCSNRLIHPCKRGAKNSTTSSSHAVSCGGHLNTGQQRDVSGKRMCKSLGISHWAIHSSPWEVSFVQSVWQREAPEARNICLRKIAFGNIQQSWTQSETKIDKDIWRFPKIGVPPNPPF